MGRLKTSSLVNGHIYQYGTLFHQFQHGACNEVGGLCTGASDRLHDCRARNVIEAIMWHGNAQSDARWTIEKFRTLSKEDREAVVKFIEAI